MKNLFKKVVVSILNFEAKILLARHKPKIIAITGSVGKTSIKDAIYSILKKKYPTRKSDKSFNSDIGVPLTVLGLPNAWSNPFFWIKNIVDGFFIAFFSREYPTYLILETGVDRPGDMKKLAKWIKPHIVVLTRFPDVPVHVEFFSTPEAIVEEKMALVEALDPNGVVVYNSDDQVILSQLPNIRQQAIGYGRYLNTHFKAVADQIVYNDDEPVGIKFLIEHINDSAEVRVMGAVGESMVYTYAGAIAVAFQCGISLDEAVLALQSHEPPRGRLRIIKGLKGTVIIDDTYNASPAAVANAITTLKEIKYAKRRIAVLGDMLELGKFSAREHERVGEMVAKGVDALFTLGIRSRKIAESALAFGMDESNIFQYEDVMKAGRELQIYLKAGDVVLIKGSQSIRAEKVVEEIMQEPELASALLVRQDKAWLKR
jgi:UDP-N-acetylmuramoyl-tripeptide--D-alanyl-D-alanine ligase